MRIRLAAACLAVCWPGVAQAQPSTNCTFIGNRMNCQQSAPLPTIQPFDVGPLIEAHRAGQAARQRQVDETREHAQVVRIEENSRAKSALRSRVTGLLREGKCTEAIDAALAGEDLALANDAKQFCR